MKNITLYVHKDTLIHKISPITKLYYILTSVLTPIILENILVSIFVIILNIIILLIARVIKYTLRLLSLNIILIISIVLIQGVLNPDNKTVLFTLGELTFYKEGIYLATKIILRLFIIVSSFSILVLTSKPFQIVESLEQRGLSPKISYIFSSVLQIIPDMINTTKRILNAQQSRGLETKGNLIVRLKSFIPLLGPVLLSSVVNTKERALALEIRGFNSNKTKTYLNVYNRHWYDSLSKYISIITLLLSIIWRIING